MIYAADEDALLFNNWIKKYQLAIPKAYYIFYSMLVKLTNEIGKDGYLIVTVDSLAKRLGWTKSTIYRMIKLSKEHKLIRVELNAFKLLEKPWRKPEAVAFNGNSSNILLDNSSPDSQYHNRKNNVIFMKV